MSPLPHLAMGDGAEFDAIRRMLTTWSAQAEGIGDDAAILDIPQGERLVVSTDASVEGVHFKREWFSGEEIGARAASAALSDLAAMAATPRGLLLALGLPTSWRSELEALARGVGAAAAAVHGPILGGNIAASEALSLTITVLGSAAHPVRRVGALPGDLLYVTGLLGGPGAALRDLRRGATPSAEHRARFAQPSPRVREALWLAGLGAHAAIDISDGLLSDAAHLARASAVSLLIDAESLPRMAGVDIADAAISGEEYELLVAMPAEVVLDERAFEARFGVRLSRIGRVVPREHADVTMIGADVPRSTGHDHLR